VLVAVFATSAPGIALAVTGQHDKTVPLDTPVRLTLVVCVDERVL
jgi:hypothetical protein